MTRRLLNLLTALSLLLCVAIVVLWVRSHRYGDQWSWSTCSSLPGSFTARRVSVLSGEGQVLAFSEREEGTGPDSFRSDWTLKPGLAWHDSPDEFGWCLHNYVGVRHTALGFGFGGLSFDGAGNLNGWYSRRHALLFPYWALLVGTAILPARHITTAMGRTLARRKQARTGCCARCGYDLRATPDRCPECGAAPSAPTGA